MGGCTVALLRSAQTITRYVMLVERTGMSSFKCASLPQHLQGGAEISLDGSGWPVKLDVRDT